MSTSLVPTGPEDGSKDSFNILCREHLWDLKMKAEQIARWEGLNPTWKQAYLDLAKALDYCDAVNARSEVH